MYHLPWCEVDAEFTVSFDKEHQGPVPDENKVAGNVMFFVEHLGTAPRLVLEYHFGTESRTGLYKAKSRLEFAFNKTTAISPKPADKLEDRLIDRHEISDLDMILTGDDAQISFTSEGGRAHDVYCYTQFASRPRQVISRDRLEAEQLWVLGIVERVAKLEPGKTCTINIKLIEDFNVEHQQKRDKKTPIMQLADMIPSKSNGRVDPSFQGHAYSTYRNKPGGSDLQFDQSSTGARVFRSPHPGAPIRAPVVYEDHEEYALHLSIGLEMIKKEQRTYCDAIVKNDHRVMVFAAGNFAVASIKLSHLLASDLPNVEVNEKLKIPVDTIVKLTMYGESNEMKKWHATGVVQADFYGFNSDLFVLILDRSREDLSSLIMDHRDARRDEQKILKVHVKPLLSDLTTKMGMNAVNSAFSIENKPDDPDYRRETPPSKHFDSIDAEAVKNAWKKLSYSHEKWNSAQRAAIKDIQHPMAGIQLFTGAVGTGKSLVMSRIQQMIVFLGIKCLVVGNQNKSLDLLTQTLVAVLGPNPKKMVTRVHSTAPDFAVHPNTDRIGPQSEVEEDIYMANLFAAWKVAEDTFKSKRRVMPDHSVYAHVLEYLTDKNNRLMGFYTDGVDENKDPIPVGDQVDMHAELRALLKRLEDPKTSNFHDGALWPLEEKRKLCQCLRFCRHNVIHNTQVAVCTNVVSGSRELAEFACKDNDRIVLFMDEATEINPALALVLLQTMYAHKIKGIYMFGDTRQLNANLVAGTDVERTMSESYDDPWISWFERLLYNGFPSNHFVVQRRQHKLIHEPVNGLHYQKSNLTTDPRLLEDLKPERENVLVDFLGLCRGTTHEQIKRRYAYITIIDSTQTHPPGSNSYMNQPHIDFVMQRARLEGIQKYYGPNTIAKVLIQVPYRAQLKAYKAMISKLGLEWGWSRDRFPNVKTIDSGIGGEADFVINDLTVEDSLGFTKNPRRDCLMASRARNYQIIITGPLTKLSRESTTVMTNFHVKSKPNYQYQVGGPINHHFEYAKKNKCWYKVKSTSSAVEPLMAADKTTDVDYPATHAANEAVAVND
ncbi:hypothetical protein M436DRAFT_63985 [Aureobasidium namibiae CBS 147.97]|uniref:DNA2/NAM7 helicase-like C-terminal domain-containing protein n=1 Tax=Aureobasidium namibiae CBS 147.97 TaxID=1043004 RepID=A0A074WSR2_9PEZI